MAVPIQPSPDILIFWQHPIEDPQDSGHDRGNAHNRFLEAQIGREGDASWCEGMDDNDDGMG